MKHSIDFKALKSQISLQDLVKHFHLELTEKGEQLHGNCPFPKHAGDGNSGSFAIKTTHNLYICHTHCGAGEGCIDFYCDMTGLDKTRDALKAAIQLKNLFGRVEHNQTNLKPAKSVLKPNTPTLSNQPKNLHIDLKRNVPYLAKTKKLTDKTIRFFDIGQALIGTLKDHIAIPMHNTQEQRIGYAGQNLETKQWKFYFNKSIELFNYHRVKAQNPKFIIVVEGFYSAMYLWQQGLHNVVAIMGNMASNTQIDLLKTLSKNTVLFLDNDKAGRAGTKSLEEKLSKNGQHVKAVMYPHIHQDSKPNKLSMEEIMTMIY